MNPERAPQSRMGTSWLDTHDLSPRYRLFVLVYLETCNATESARRAGYRKPKQQGTRMLSYVAVRAAISDGQARLEEQAMLNAEGIVRMWSEIATANVADLMGIRIGACRYCHGVDHAYQWRTEREYREALQQSAYDLYSDDDLRTAAVVGEIEDARLPRDEGGFGYRRTIEPDPDCPECDGHGVEYVHMADTSKLTGGARLLYQGVEETQAGKRLRIADRMKALENLARHFGMFAGKAEKEDTSPLTRLAERLMANATSAPIRSDLH